MDMDKLFNRTYIIGTIYIVKIELAHQRVLYNLDRRVFNAIKRDLDGIPGGILYEH